MANKIPDDTLREARAEAVRQLVNRERRDGLHAMLGALSRAMAWRREILDESAYDDDDDLNDLGTEHGRIALEWEVYLAYGITYLDGEPRDQRGRPCALDLEDLDAATRRVLLERGATTYQVALAVPDVAIQADSVRTRADRLKRARHAQLEANLAEVKHSIIVQPPIPAGHGIVTM